MNLIDYDMPYIVRREIIGKDYKLGFDYLPKHYDSMDRHKQNNEYMIALWRNEDDHLQDAMYEFEELEKVHSNQRLLVPTTLVKEDEKN